MLYLYKQYYIILLLYHIIISLNLYYFNKFVKMLNDPHCNFLEKIKSEKNCFFLLTFSNTTKIKIALGLCEKQKKAFFNTKNNALKHRF